VARSVLVKTGGGSFFASECDNLGAWIHSEQGNSQANKCM
jgi:hypothetical protein